MADAIQTLPNTKNDLIISLVQKELIESAMLAGTVRDLSGFASKGTQSIKVPKLSSFTVSNRAFGAAEDAQALTDANDTLSLDQNAYIAWLEDHRDNYQSSIEYRMEASQRAARAHAKYVDQQIITTAEAVAFHNIASVLDVTKDDVLEMRKLLLQSNADISQMVMVSSVDQEAALLGIADFVRADAYGSSNIPDGSIGRLYGVNVMVSNLVKDGQVLMYERDGMGIAFQEGVQMSEQDANEYGALSKRVAVDQVFGTAGLELGEQGAGGTQSPLVAKLIA